MTLGFAALMFNGMIPSVFVAPAPGMPIQDSEKSQSESPKAGAEKSSATRFVVADGNLVMVAPAGWKQVIPAVRMIEAEFSIEPKEGEGQPGRLTVMGAGGSIEANIDRWLNQVQQPDGSFTRDKATVTNKEVDGLTIHLVDVSGTYVDQRGPQAPKIELKDHRLLAAIIETGSIGNYFVKFYGPEEIVAQHRDAFVQMVEAATVVK